MRDEVTIKLNQASVMEAMQAYLDLHLTPKMKLMSFESDGQSNYNAKTYTCVLAEIKEPA